METFGPKRGLTPKEVEFGHRSSDDRVKSSASRKVAGSNHGAGKIFQREISAKSPTHATSDSFVGNFHV